MGHFLRGSAATLGLTRIKDSCERIWYLGQGKDEKGEGEGPGEEIAVRCCAEFLVQIKVDYEEASRALRKFYERKG